MTLSCCEGVNALSVSNHVAGPVAGAEKAGFSYTRRGVAGCRANRKQTGPGRFVQVVYNNACSAQFLVVWGESTVVRNQVQEKTEHSRMLAHSKIRIAKRIALTMT